MSDQVLTPDSAGVPVSAVARSMTTVGFGLFALLQPGGLNDVLSLSQVTERLARDEAVRAQQYAAAEAAAAMSAAAAAGAPSASVAAQLSGLDPDVVSPAFDVQPEEPQVQAVQAAPVQGEPEPQTQSAAPTLAMLKEISFLDD